MEFQMRATRFKVVLGVIGADCHAVGNKIIMSVLAPQGIEVVNLGVMVSQDEFIDAAIETGAEAILVSSIYGFTGRSIAKVFAAVASNAVSAKFFCTLAAISSSVSANFPPSRRCSRIWASTASSSPASIW